MKNSLRIAWVFSALLLAVVLSPSVAQAGDLTVASTWGD